MEDLRLEYDALCYATMVNVSTLTSGANRIVLKNVDWNNLEHKFVIHVINACYNILGSRDVAIDVGPLTRGTIARECRSFGRVRKVQKDEQIFVDVPEMLEFMRGHACKICGDTFTFGDIYDAYYSGKEKR